MYQNNSETAAMAERRRTDLADDPNGGVENSPHSSTELEIAEALSLEVRVSDRGRASSMRERPSGVGGGEVDQPDRLDFKRRRRSKSQPDEQVLMVSKRRGESDTQTGNISPKTQIRGAAMDVPNEWIYPMFTLCMRMYNVYVHICVDVCPVIKIPV